MDVYVDFLLGLAVGALDLVHVDVHVLVQVVGVDPAVVALRVDLHVGGRIDAVDVFCHFGQSGGADASLAT